MHHRFSPTCEATLGTAVARVILGSLFVAAASLVAPCAADAQAVELHPVRDATIYSDSSRANGQGQFLFAGRTGNGELRRALIAFDPSAAIPAGSVVTDVMLSLLLTRSTVGTDEVALHKLNQSWAEGPADPTGMEGQGITAGITDVSWTQRGTGTNWTEVGGDHASLSSQTQAVGTDLTRVTWSSLALMQDVQSWLDTPGDNHGWLLVGDESTDETTKRFSGADHVSRDQWPILTVSFTAPATAGGCCAVDGSCTVAAGAGACTGSYLGDGLSCVPNTCPQPPGACCTPDVTASCNELSEAACATASGEFRGIGSSCGSVRCATVLTPYVDALPLPAVALPVDGAPGEEADYLMTMREIRQKLHRDLPATRVWGYDDGQGASYPGPTFETYQDKPVNVIWRNEITDVDTGLARESHVLNVDQCLHGADNQRVRTVVHLHGGHIEARYDGYPEHTIEPGEEIPYVYGNGQPASTLWYHDHAMGITRLNVYMGLAGFYIIRDDHEASLDLPRGQYEIPLVLQDRTFRPDGSLDYPVQWAEHAFGDTNLVNGKVWPFLEVAQGKYRFRLLNGSNGRTYLLELSNLGTITQIGTDGGLLPEAIDRFSLRISPGERAEVVIDFSQYAPGTEIILRNRAPAPYPKGVLDRSGDVMKFIVTDRAGHTADLPRQLREIPAAVEAEAVMERDFVLEKTTDDCTGSTWKINGLGWNVITEYPQLGTREIWRFINPSGLGHPMHVHLDFFQVLDQQWFTENDDGSITLIGSPRPPDPGDRGYKDTVLVDPNEVVRVMTRFEDFPGRYVYHCHILEHEDHVMMRQFEIENRCGDGARALITEACDDGNNLSGDGCESDCSITLCDGKPCDAGVAADAGGVDSGASTGGSSTGGAGRPNLGIVDAAGEEDAASAESVAGGGGCSLVRDSSAPPWAAPSAWLGALGLVMVIRRRRRTAA